MNDGIVQEFGKVEELLANPSSVFRGMANIGGVSLNRGSYV